MNPREKTLAIMVGGLLTLAGLWAVIQWGMIDRWQTLHNRIEKAYSDADRVHKSLKLAKESEADWSALRPLSHNADRAENAFRQDMNQLLEKNGLNEDCTIGPLPQRKLKNEFTEVRLSIRARGHLQQVVNFLCDFYERDYLARLDQINLTADEKPPSVARGAAASGATRSARGRRGSRSTAAVARDESAYGPEGPMLNISIVATALVLPQLRIGNTEVPQPTVGQAVQEGGEPIERLPRPREEYARIWETNIFKLYQEPPPPPPPGPIVQRDRPETDRDEVKPIEPPPPRPNKAAKGLTSTFGKLAVYVYDLDDPGKEPEKVEINQAVDDGTLVLVVPDGMVVQVSEQHGSATAVKYYFYPLGCSFQDRQELDPRECPEIQAQLDRALSG